MRVRITLTVSVLVGFALTAAGVIAYTIQEDRLREQVNLEIDQELGEFAALQGGVDPETGRAFSDAETLIRTFLSRNVPDDDELLLGWWDDGPRVASPGAHPLTRDPSFVAFLEDRITTGGSTAYTSSESGDLLVTVQPVRGERDGALVVLKFLDETRAGLYDTFRTYAIVATVLLMVVTALAAWQSGRLLRPIRTLRETLGDITAADLSGRIPERGNDDITALTRTVNEMLDRLEAGFEGQRRFLDDAGHELRTPLTVLRGHLELLDTGSPEDVAETQALLLDETDRMSRLVGDLILLTKSRRPGFVHRAPTDLEALLGSVLAKARALGDRDWRLSEVAPGTVDLDEQRVTQALLQLADNAVKHTVAGDTIAFAATYHDDLLGDDVVLSVSDSGPGVPADDQDRIFERFARSDVSAADDGFGLGLSIVRAIAEAHGGTARVTTAADGGARFEITIPGKDEPWPAS